MRKVGTLRAMLFLLHVHVHVHGLENLFFKLMVGLVFRKGIDFLLARAARCTKEC